MKPRTNDKKIFDFHVAGVPYRLKTSHDEATAQELINFVKGKVDEALPLTKNSSFQNAAVLAAMNIAEDYVLLKKKALKEIEALEEQTTKIISEFEKLKAQTKSM